MTIALTEKKPGGRGQPAAKRVLAGSVAEGAGVVGAVDYARTILASVVVSAPDKGTAGPAVLGPAGLSTLSL